MSDETRLEDLLMGWAELRGQGQDVRLEDYCRDCPELLPRLRDEVNRLQSLERRNSSGESRTLASGELGTLQLNTDAREQIREAAEAGKLGPAGRTFPRPFGDYDLLEEIARGGMGVVYLARQKSLKRLVALKMILSGELADKEAVQRFHTEAEAAGQLRHPGIVAVYEVGERDGQHYFSMEYIEGRSLAALAREKPFSPVQAARIVQSVAEAVQYAHQQGVLHRDLKPSNVLIDTDGRPRVTDFGLAKRMTEGDSGLTKSCDIVGTPSYMPPEQAAGRIREISPASDVYSLGALLYELLTGRPPFRADNALDTILEVIQLEPVAPHKINKKTPRDIETICLKCLEKESARRYSAAKELADDLGRFITGESIVAKPVSTISRGWRWCRRQRSWLGPCVAAIVLVAGIGAYAYVKVAHSSNLSALRVEAEKEMSAAQTLLQAAHGKLDTGDFKGAEKDAGNAVEILDRLAKSPAEIANRKRWLAEAHNLYGRALYNQGRFKDAIVQHANVARLWDPAGSRGSRLSEIDARGSFQENEIESLLTANAGTAACLVPMGRLTEAFELSREEEELRGKLRAANPQDSDVWQQLATRTMIARVMHEWHDTREAEEYLAEADGLAKPAAAETDRNAIHPWALCNLVLGRIRIDLGHELAEENLQRATAAYEELANINAFYSLDVAICNGNQARWLATNDPREGEARLKEAIARMYPERTKVFAKDALATMHAELGELLLTAEGGQDKAALEFREALRLRRELVDGHAGALLFHYRLAELLVFCESVRDAERARKLMEQAVENAAPADKSWLRVMLAAACYQQGEFAQAAAMLSDLDAERTKFDRGLANLLSLLVLRELDPQLNLDAKLQEVSASIAANAPNRRLLKRLEHEARRRLAPGSER